MSQREPGSLEDDIVQWLNGRAETFEAAFNALVSPIVNHPYFTVAVLAVVVYLIVAARGRKGK